MQKRRWMAVIATLLALAIPVRVLAAEGSILYLITWGGYAADTPVYVQTTVQATTDVNKTNLYYTITGPGSESTLRATHSTPLEKMDAWQTVTDEWSVMNSGWPEGDYTVSLCWSPGNSTNCNIAGPVTAEFHSVPTLGWPLGIAAVGILLVWLWMRRREFAPGRKTEAA
jgi:hypothetical protein